MHQTTYQNKYKISSVRIPDYDYSQNGAYFVTICTHKKIKNFGEIIDEKNVFSNEAKIASIVWEKLPQQFDGIELGEWIIMPNHIHGIVIIDSLNESEKQHTKVNKNNCGGVTQSHNPMLKNSLSSIIRWFKGRSTFEIRKVSPHFSWQSRFYEHVIRNQTDFDRVSKYIVENPIAWRHDEYFI